jgi:metal-responsive CopG/Arc/MetJ family transcriptional regulator
MPRSAVSKVSASRKIIVDFPAALYEETQKAVQELSIKRSVLIRKAISEYCIVWRGGNLRVNSLRAIAPMPR